LIGLQVSSLIGVHYIFVWFTTWIVDRFTMRIFTWFTKIS